MKKFAIIANPLKENSGRNIRKIRRILEKNGCECTASLLSQENTAGGDFLYTNPELVPEGTEVILSLGGDGTFIHASKDLIKLGLPVFGINYGTLGYLTEVDIDGFEDAVRAIVRGDYEIEKRILTRCDIIRNGKTIHSRRALNDIVVNRSLDTGIAELEVRVGGELLSSYSADGIIISTPTGSTGYNLSAGGPVVLPTAKIMLITPICAHTLNSRSVVLPADVSVEIISRNGSREKKKQNFVTVDGEKAIALEAGDIVRAKMAKEAALILRTNKASFVEKLGKKMS